MCFSDKSVNYGCPDNVFGAASLSVSRQLLVLAALMPNLLLAALDSTIVRTAMKTIAGELMGMDQYTWPFTIYMLCSTVVIPISGGFADVFGRKPVFFGTAQFGSDCCALL
ncbi:MAG: MFS transporter [Clostridiales bacterium]|nr:MFS transporter [Clostridiales bacterium]